MRQPGEFLSFLQNDKMAHGQICKRGCHGTMAKGASHAAMTSIFYEIIVQFVCPGGTIGSVTVRTTWLQ